jgi:FemAB-related protein (PEP-CTERM system-associated)
MRADPDKVQGPPSSTDAPESLRAAVSVSRAESGDVWDRYVDSHPLATVDHAWGWRRVFESALAHRTAYLIASRTGRTCGVLPLVLFHSRLFGRSAISLPFLNYGGMLADDAETGRALVAGAEREGRQFGASHVEFRHTAAQCPALPARQHKVAMTLALASTVDGQWTAIDRKIRNQVRKAQKEGLTSASGGQELVDEFYAVFSRNMRDLGTPVYPKALFVETLRVFEGQAAITLVRRGDQAIAAAVTLAFRQTVLNPWASALREFRNLSPNVLLYWAMVESAIGRGATVFDFGRSSPGGGTYQFKEQWGAVPTPMHWEYVLIGRSDPPNQGPTNPKFERAIELWKKLPMPVANFVGPLIARHLP